MSISSVSIIGGGFTGVTTAFLTVLELGILKKLGEDISALKKITIIGKVTTGPAYDALSEAQILNRTVAVMDPVAKDIHAEPYSFFNYLKAFFADKGYDNDSFVPRGLYGSYIHFLHAQTISLAKNFGLGDNFIENITSHATAIKPDGNGGYIITHQDGTTTPTDYIVLATGHEFEVREALKDHENYYVPYYGDTWKEKFKAVVNAVFTRTKVYSEFVFLGWGGTNLDNIMEFLDDPYIASLLLKSDRKITVYSPLGDTSIPFYGKRDPDAGQKEVLRLLTDSFYERVDAFAKEKPNLSKNDIRAEIANQIRTYLFEEAKKHSPVILEQQVIEYLLTGDNLERINDPKNINVHDVAIVFNGNPVAPQRIELWNAIKRKINFVQASIKDAVPVGSKKTGSIKIEFEGNQPPVVTDGLVVEGTIIRRALARDKNGQIINPLLRQMSDDNLFQTADGDTKILPTYAGHNIAAAGVITYYIANSVGVFYTGIKSVAKTIASGVTGQATAIDFVNSLEYSIENKGKPIYVLDVRGAANDDVLSEFDEFNIKVRSGVRVIKASFNAGDANLHNDKIKSIPRGAIVYVLCKKGIRSTKAIQALKGSGLNLVNIQGGVEEILQRDPDGKPAVPLAKVKKLFAGTLVNPPTNDGPSVPTLSLDVPDPPKSACG